MFSYQLHTYKLFSTTCKQYFKKKKHYCITLLGIVSWKGVKHKDNEWKFKTYNDYYLQASAFEWTNKNKKVRLRLLVFCISFLFPWSKKTCHYCDKIIYQPLLHLILELQISNGFNFKFVYLSIFIQKLIIGVSYL